MAVGNLRSPGAVTVINGQMPAGASMGNQDSPGSVFINNGDSSFLRDPPFWGTEAGNNGGGRHVDNRGGSINRSVNAGSIAPGAVITTGDGNTIVPSPRVQGFQQGSMGATQTPAYQGRTQTASANPQQGGFSQRQTTASVNQPETLSQRVGNVFKNAAGYGLVAVAASGGALLAPVAVAAVAVIAAYKAIQALEAVMNLFKGANKGQQTTQQQQQQQQAGNRASRIHTFMGDVNLDSPNPTYAYPQPRQAGQQQQQTQGQNGQQTQPPVAQSTTAQAPAPVQGEQQPTYQQLAIPGLESTSNANGASTGIQFTQDVNLGGVDAPSAGFNMDTVAQALEAARGGR